MREETEHAEKQLVAQWQPWHQRILLHRSALLAGAGLATGFALATLPPKWWSRIGSAVFGGGARLARSGIAMGLLAALSSAARQPPREP